MRIKGCTLFLICTVMCVLSGYSQVTTGTISGTVKDSTGAILPGVQVVVLNEDTGLSRTVLSDETGHYSAPQLSLGNFRVSASLEGFQTEVRRGLVLTLGREAVVDIQLTVGAITQTVEVTGEAPLVQTKDATVGYLVQDSTIRDLPLNGRDLQQLILLNPSVGEAMNPSSGSAYAGFGKKISISGLRTEDNSYLLDGSFIADFSRHAPTGPSGALLGSETVREFQVLTNSFSAQYGRVLGGVFNAVSKSGTNDFHGNVYEYLRNDALDSTLWETNRVGASKPPFRRNQFGATAGGPIVRDKTFFFANYEGFRESLTRTIVTPVPDENARKGILSFLPTPVPVSPKIQPFLNAIPLPSPNGLKVPSAGTQEFIWQGTDTKHENFFQGRIDHSFSSNDTFFARVTVSNATGHNAEALPMFSDEGILNSRLVTLAETHIFSARILNTHTFSVNRVDPIDKGNYPKVGPELTSIPGQATTSVGYGWGGAPKPLDRWTTNRFNYRDDVNWTLGKHTVQFGGMLERMQFNMNQPSRPFGQWTFADIQQFLLARPRQYRGTPPQVGNTQYNAVRGMRQTFGALYAEDTWQIVPGFTFSLGARWEPYATPTEVNNLLANIRHPGDSAATVGGPYWKNKSWGDIGPRMGFAWSPFKNGKTSIRGGAGIFYVPNDGTMYFIQATRTPPYFPDLAFTQIDPNLFPDGIATILSAASPLGSPEAIEFDNLRSPSSYQFNLNIQQQFGDNTVLSVGYVGNRGVHVTTYGDYNAPVAFFNGVSLEVPSNAKRPNPNFEALNYYTNGGRSWYDGLAVSLQRRLGSGFRGQVSYTYSKALSHQDAYSKVDRSGSSGSPAYPYDLSKSKALSGYHLGQKLSFNYTYDLPLGRGLTGVAGQFIAGWQLSGIVTIQSGQPFDVINASGATPNALSTLGYTRKPNVNPAFQGKVIQGGPDQYFNPQAFILPTSGFELGNVGRNTLVGPGFAKWDSSLNKTMSLTERWKMQFRAEVFNLLNHPNFGKPSGSIFTSNGLRLQDAGRINTTVGSARQIQLGLKLMF
jgi:Carboxypeptidase regulatory-like domain